MGSKLLFIPMIKEDYIQSRQAGFSPLKFLFAEAY